MPAEIYGPYPVRNADFDGDLIADEAAITFEKVGETWTAKGVYQSSQDKSWHTIENITVEKPLFSDSIGTSAKFSANFIPKSASGISADATADAFTLTPTHCRSLLGLFWSYGDQSVAITSGQTYTDLKNKGVNTQGETDIDVAGDSMDESARLCIDGIYISDGINQSIAKEYHISH